SARLRAPQREPAEFGGGEQLLGANQVLPGAEAELLNAMQLCPARGKSFSTRPAGEKKSRRAASGPPGAERYEASSAGRWTFQTLASSRPPPPRPRAPPAVPPPH